MPRESRRGILRGGTEGGVIPAHRWVSAVDLSNLFSLLRKVYKQYPSLEDLFLEGYNPNDPDIGPALHRFSKKMKSLAPRRAMTRGFRYFFPSPADGSACKRLNLFLRWMVRKKDGIDLGLWKKISPSKLVVPLDVHLYNFGRRHQLSRTKTPNWKMAQEITRFLRRLDPEDPIKFDFAICHHGMEGRR